MMPSEMKRLRELEDENGPLEADRGGPLARQGDASGRYQAKALRPARKRKLVDEMRADGRCQRAGPVVSLCFDRKSYRYRSRRPGQAPSREAISKTSARPACVMGIAECM